MKIHKYLLAGLICAACIANLSCQKAAEPFRLMLYWNANLEPNLREYKVYWCSGNVNWIVSVPPTKTTFIYEFHIEPKDTLRFFVAAVNQRGQESAFSNEAKFGYH